LGAGNTTIEGTGLGLALSKRLTEAMGGQIGMEDVPNGASFYVDLPIACSPLEVLETADWQEAAHPAARQAESRTILLVEDNLSNVKLIEKILSSRPCIRLITAMQGTIALELAREHLPDLILLDLNLPDMHGEQVLGRLQEELATRDIPVAVVSADATPSQIDRLKDSGAIAYLTKPLDIRAFRDLLEETLGQTSVKKSA
jgi:CheY-like chemotaxis protein